MRYSAKINDQPNCHVFEAFAKASEVSRVLRRY